MKKYEESIEKLKKYIIQFPNLPEGYYYLGKNYKEIEENDKSLYYFEKAVKLGMKFADCWYSLGELYFEDEDYKTAVFYYQNIPTENYTFPNYGIHYGISLANEGKIKESIKVLKDALNRHENNYDETLFYYGEILIIHKDKEHGIEILNKVSSSGSKFALRAELMLGLVYEQLYDEEESFKHYNYVLKNGSESIDDLLYFMVRRTSLPLLEPLSRNTGTANLAMLASLTRSFPPECIYCYILLYIKQMLLVDLDLICSTCQMI